MLYRHQRGRSPAVSSVGVATSSAGLWFVPEELPSFLFGREYFPHHKAQVAP